MRRTAAEIAAAAVCELYPQVELYGGGETPTGFFYDFSCPYPVQLQVIEEKMRQLVRERRPIRTLEMVALSAGELLKSKGHLSRLDELEEGLVELIEIGAFHDLSPGPHLKNTAELAAFKIELEGTRLIGYCHTSKEALKQYLKKLRDYVPPQQLGEAMGLWQGRLWLPSGLKLRQQLIDFLKRELVADGLEVSGPPEGDRTELHRTLKAPKIGEIWTDPQSGEVRFQISFFHKSESEYTSSLQSIGKTLTILGFDHSALSHGRETAYWIEDELGQKWPVVQVKRSSNQIDWTLIVEVERMFSLLLEKNLILQMVEV